MAFSESAHPMKSTEPIFNLANSSRLDCPGSRLGAQSPNSRSSVFWLVQSWSRLELLWSRLGSQFPKVGLLPFDVKLVLESTRAVWESTRISEAVTWSSVCRWSHSLGVDSRTAGVDSNLRVHKTLSDFFFVYRWESTRVPLESTRISDPKTAL